ncbi:MAG: helix-hairpin-helix domain-containing protein [Omnitrophica bacterium]|nr:helix-hairpin-helix domain-containing protein [Candidatus Omnitrophota bacterium]
MIYRIKGRLIKKAENSLIIDVGGIAYEVNSPQAVIRQINNDGQQTVDLVIYHYLNIDKNKGIPVLVGFLDELERDFFEKFISVTGVGPKAALKAFDKPIPAIARAIEEGNVDFLMTLAGIGRQRAKQIIVHLQGKVGRFALIKEGEAGKEHPKGEIVAQAKKILKRLQYNSKEAESMIKKASAARSDVDTVEELLNEIYRQRK